MTRNHKVVHNVQISLSRVSGIKVLDDGKSGELLGITRLTNMVDGKRTADLQGLAVVHHSFASCARRGQYQGHPPDHILEGGFGL